MKNFILQRVDNQNRDNYFISRTAKFEVGMPRAISSLILFSTMLISFVASQLAVADTSQSSGEFNDIVWAINVGGDAYQGNDRIAYLADSGNYPETTSIGSIDGVSSIGDDTVFKTYRSGEFGLTSPIENGVYAITFKFAEPFDTAVGERVFDVLAEDKIVIDDLDVRVARDGNVRAALTHTVMGVEVNDGKLEIALRADKGEPILSAVVVKRKTPRAERWSLVWEDNFDYEGAPDPKKWTHDIWPAAKVNREDQQYTDSPDNVRVSDGRLIIEAHKIDGEEAKYSSGRIHSAGKGDFLYGRAEVRAKLPAGQGTWAAIWMLPTDPFRYASNCEAGEDWQGSDTCDAWPNSGEIDIMEHVGYDMNRVHGTVHTKSYYWVNGQQRKGSVDAKNVAEEFHNYALEWSPEKIDIFFNDVRYFTYFNNGEDWRSWPFDHPYHLILNLAIGGDWGRAGGPIDDSIFPVQMEVDYVRVYQKNK